MQKRILAPVLISLLTAFGTAHADNTNVVVYGKMDLGISSYSGSKGYKSRTGVDGALKGGTRIGFKGSEDIGNGNKVMFKAEFGFDPEYKSSNVFGKKDIYLGLSGNWGTVLAGRNSTPEDTLLGLIDPFKRGTVGDIEKGWVTTSLVNILLPQLAENKSYSEYQNSRFDNSLFYITPDWNGFHVTLAATNHGMGDEPYDKNHPGGTNKRTNAKIFAISPVYDNGTFLIGANYHYIKMDNEPNLELLTALSGTNNNTRYDVKDIKNSVWDIAAAYDFGPVRISGAYGQIKLEAKSSEVNKKKYESIPDMKMRQAMLGAEIRITDADRLMLSIAHYNAKKMAAYLESDKVKMATKKDTKNTKWAIGYYHDLSKCTNLYAGFAKFSKKNKLANVGGEASAGYTKGFNLGLLHNF